MMMITLMKRSGHKMRKLFLITVALAFFAALVDATSTLDTEAAIQSKIEAALLEAKRSYDFLQRRAQGRFDRALRNAQRTIDEKTEKIEELTMDINTKKHLVNFYKSKEADAKEWSVESTQFQTGFINKCTTEKEYRHYPTVSYVGCETWVSEKNILDLCKSNKKHNIGKEVKAIRGRYKHFKKSYKKGDIGKILRIEADAVRFDGPVCEYYEGYKVLWKRGSKYWITTARHEDLKLFLAGPNKINRRKKLLSKLRDSDLEYRQNQYSQLKSKMENKDSRKKLFKEYPDMKEIGFCLKDFE